jgi:hypothetical protein
MPYIKISDPNIIDLAAWHQVINVINQHSDSISAITNNFGIQASSPTDWSGQNDIYEEFNPGSQKILYGKYQIDTRALINGEDNPNEAQSSDAFLMYYAEIEFANPDTATTGFKEKPIVTVTAAAPREDVDPMVNTNAELVCTVIGTTKDRFFVRIIRARDIDNPTVINATTKPESFFNINWMAIGPS